MLIAPALVCIALALQDKPAPPDHSGEAKLKHIFELGGAIRDVHLNATYYNLEMYPQRYNESSSSDFWFGRMGRFRIVTSSNYWGGGSTNICDGYAMLSDDMSDDGTIRIAKAPKAMHEVNENEPWLFVFEGSRGYEAFVDKDKAITLVKNKQGEAVDFTAKKLGRVVLYYEEAMGQPFPTKYELYKAPWWADDPGDGTNAFTRAILRVVQASGIPLNVFSIKPPAGRKVADERKSKSSS
jgi:hypothetical protein